MKLRCLRLVLLALLAMVAVDLVDADCFDAAARGEASCNEAAGDCACCLLSEAASRPPLVAGLRASAPLASSGTERTRAGIRPVPYRPPLTLG
jgi:hypothetical protein